VESGEWRVESGEWRVCRGCHFGKGIGVRGFFYELLYKNKGTNTPILRKMNYLCDIAL